MAAKKKSEQKESVSFTLKLPNRLVGILDRRCTESKRSRNAEVNWILENYLERFPRHVTIMESIFSKNEQF